ncbi:enoyl-CoA hydratase/isomerase family protein [Crocinitomicaceae bacterium CZZ-1]|uniref:Enoyl-CoA hydratase/isomerase family protein n=1 Tax=Taishania pollutisoli TaxID=2766479 RepID=A0A8J6PL29_9FLAO|nr:enoyl-CoA hydratase-related protein [Taishania pollutisoli]MBC9812780.1 enoyl-CoA hydratase/isomerase family protein [Taishania pollutisoli]MBX2949769.1 enoyl-CoA hydratase/isomerase family protein [Crocinitomicaceae bacterium]
MYNNILAEKNGQIQLITINRPAQLNALNKETIEELSQAIQAAEQDTTVGVIILTGSGEKSFVAGADIKEFAHFTIAEGGELAQKGQQTLFDLVENLSKPVIAAVNGFALGGGLELAMSAHIRVASSNARVGLPEVSLGVIPGYGGTQRLAQLVGKGKANELVFTAGMIKADEALTWGLVNHVVEPEELMAKATEIAEKILANSGAAIASAIRSINAGFKDGVNGYETEILEFGKCFGTADFKEGTTAFIEKRKPNFRG